MRSPERTIPWSSAIRMWSIWASLRDVEPDTRTASGGGSDSQLAADQPGALGHPGQADAARVGRVAGVEALAVVAHAQLHAVRWEDAQVEVDEGRVRVLRGVRKRLLHHPVDDGLLILCERFRGALVVEAGLDRSGLAEARDLPLESGDQSHVVQRRRA